MGRTFSFPVTGERKYNEKKKHAPKNLPHRREL